MNQDLHEDQELKRLASSHSRPVFDWPSILAETDLTGDPVLRDEDGKLVTAARVAATLGEALTLLWLARGKSPEDIFGKDNRAKILGLVLVFRTTILKDVANAMATEQWDGGPFPMQFYQSVERFLIRNDCRDIARALAALREASLTPTTDLHTKVIRRTGQVVAWNTNKVEIAVRKAFLAVEEDSDPAVSIAAAVAKRLASDGVANIHIEQLQERVEEEIMRQGYFKAARQYIQYRAERNRERSAAPAAAVESGCDIEIVLSDGSKGLWTAADLTARVRFASAGLDLCMSESEIETELRRSIFPGTTQSAVRKTVILNAATLMQDDADFSKFAARILLTYIYEETLDWDIIRDGVGALGKAHKSAFKRYLKRAVEIDRIHPDLLSQDLTKLANAIDPTADLDFDYIGISTLYDRYLIIDKKVEPARRLEAPQFFWMRVAMGIYSKQPKVPAHGLHEPADQIAKHLAASKDWSKTVISLYNLYKSRRFCSSTPTLFNSGTLHPQLSSCYLYKVDDNIESIMQRGIAENAYLCKWAGGLGGSWTGVRGTGAFIKGTNGESQGIIPFLKVHNDQLVAVNQGGKRRGSGCAYLEVWHNDIEDFLDLRLNVGDERRRTHDLNTANWIPDLFMKRMEAREKWTLFRTNEVPDLHDLYGSAFERRYAEYEAKADAGEIFSRKVEAIDLWKLMLKRIFETGHPWITFKDPCNVRNPQKHAGVIHSSNLCTEITLNTGVDETAVCNLGSVVIDNHLDDNGDLDHTKLRDTIRIAVRALDRVIDVNFYPTTPAFNANTRHRPIGLGIMGLQYALFRKRIPFASSEAVEFNDEVMEAVAYYAYEASSDLAAELGTYSSYEGSNWSFGLLPQDTLELLEKERGQPVDVPRGGKMDWTELREKIKRQGMRNSNVVAIAPTATISNIMGSSPCIEPLMGNAFAKSNLGGDFFVLNPYLVRDLKKEGLWTKDIRDQLRYHQGELAQLEEIPEDLKHLYRTAFGIDWSYVIKAAARRQKWIDQSQSVNLWMPSTDIRPLSHMYRLAWTTGLKTTYYLRTRSASNIEAADVAVRNAKKTHTPEEVKACSIEAMRNGETCEACQ